jgi:hypothetical protein
MIVEFVGMSCRSVATSCGNFVRRRQALATASFALLRGQRGAAS